jgi:hypothetical protein
VNKHVAWISGVALTVALSVGLIVPALAVETPAAAPVAPAVSQTTTSKVPFVTTDDFAPKSVPVVVEEEKPVVKKAAKKTSAKSTTVKRTTTKSTSTVKKTSGTAKTASTSDDLATAKSVLASLQAKYRYLDGVTVRIDDTPKNYQAVAYMGRGIIVINPNHTASISTILKHEIWHIIDYRDNGTIDWGENVPRS